MSGSDLVKSGLLLTVYERGLLSASVPEVELLSRPAGMDVHLVRDGSGCARAPMD